MSLLIISKSSDYNPITYYTKLLRVRHSLGIGGKEVFTFRKIIPNVEESILKCSNVLPMWIFWDKSDFPIFPDSFLVIWNFNLNYLLFHNF